MVFMMGDLHSVFIGFGELWGTHVSFMCYFGRHFHGFSFRDWGPALPSPAALNTSEFSVYFLNCQCLPFFVSCLCACFFYLSSSTFYQQTTVLLAFLLASVWDNKNAALLIITQVSGEHHTFVVSCLQMSNSVSCGWLFVRYLVLGCDHLLACC